MSPKFKVLPGLSFGRGNHSIKLDLFFDLQCPYDVEKEQFFCFTAGVLTDKRRAYISGEKRKRKQERYRMIRKGESAFR